MRLKLSLALALAVATSLVFAEVRHFGFLSLDDGLYVAANPRVRAGLTLEGLGWAATTAWQSNWHPVTWLSLMADVELFGVNPRAHHLVNLLLHVANTLLLFLLLARLTDRVWRSAFVAALFALLLALGLMAKPTLVTLPFTLLVLDVWPLGRAEWREALRARGLCRWSGRSSHSSRSRPPAARSRSRRPATRSPRSTSSRSRSA
ncbi:MAG: hypothetical protein ACYSUM_22365 [Planctomycetota bacterium]